jgi:glycosyltransferase involved in cell wall biosynthesis
MIRSGHDASRIDVILNPAPSVLPDVVPISTIPVARFICLGRLVPEKGVDWLLHAVARLNVPVQVVIAGSGPAESALQALASQLRISKYIEWRGWLNQHQVFDELSRSHAVIIPSIWHEPAGLLTSEAAAAGRMVIASRVGGIPEYADQLQNAVLVEPGDVEALAAAMRKVASDGSFAEQLGMTGRSRVGQLNLESHLESLEEVYQKAITDSTHRPS